jgi:uncharacterized membrane protein
VHITAVMVGFGSTFALSVANSVAMKLDPRHLPYVYALSLRLNRFFASPALVIVIATGIYQTSKGNFDFGDPWISATFTIVIILGALSGAFFIPNDRKQLARAKRDIAAAGPNGPVAFGDDFNRGAKMAERLGMLTGLLLVIAVFLMVVKPGA